MCARQQNIISEWETANRKGAAALVVTSATRCQSRCIIGPDHAPRRVGMSFAGVGCCATHILLHTLLSVPISCKASASQWHRWKVPVT